MNDTPETLLALQCQICRAVLAIIPQPTAERIGERIGYLANGAILPGSGVGDLFTVAAMLGLKPDAVAAQTKKGSLPKLGLGRSMLYSLADFVQPRKDANHE